MEVGKGGKAGLGMPLLSHMLLYCDLHRTYKFDFPVNGKYVVNMEEINHDGCMGESLRSQRSWYFV